MAEINLTDSGDLGVRLGLGLGLRPRHGEQGGQEEDLDSHLERVLGISRRNYRATPFAWGFLPSTGRKLAWDPPPLLQRSR